MHIKTKITLAACIIPLIATVYVVFGRQTDILLNSLLTLFCIIGIKLTDRKWRIFSTGTYALILIFILLSTFAGRTLGAYEKVKYWDKILHFFSGFILVMIAKQIYGRLKGDTKNKSLIKSFAFFTAVTGAAFWEIFEFASDSILGTSAQNNSLTDTMLDIIAGTVSAVLSMFI